ncbi:hypothetical protein AK830_g11173 [Neonectria ditissima]|uniref:Uncharacterized protein n=1 Tax=Neonectria ditissima TaxID=78410 RepID=A0A0P7B488_9HYPO|nr:hypothetical protein AK830_g11173 [Neonectria ditissima]
MQLTWDLGMDHVRSWVLVGDYELGDRFDRPFVWSSTVVTGLSEAATAPPPYDASAHPHVDVDADATSMSHPSTPDSWLSPSSSSSSPPAMESLHGVPEGVYDALVPKNADIRRIFNDGRHTWQDFFRQALALPRGAFPAGLDPAIMFKNMPSLPDTLPPKGVLAGAPHWSVPDPDVTEPPPDQDFDLSRVTGTTKYFRLAYPDPIECCISSDPSACHYGNPPSANVGASNAPQGLAILTMCWSYIFSTRLLHLQGRKAHYTDKCLRPFPMNAVGELAHNEILLQLPAEASAPLVQWLCAILAPKPGWAADSNGGPFSPWAACCTGDFQVVVATQQQVFFHPDAEAPTDAQATELLIELCNLFGIAHEPLQVNGSVQLSPIKAAFLATLGIPFYRMAKMQPRFPKPYLVVNKDPVLDNNLPKAIHGYTADLKYYMTLSMHQWSLGPVLWSIFWQPDIQCNLVSPWLAAINSVIRPALDGCDFEMLAKVFASRRPRIALWWHGLFLLGNPKILDLIRNYLDTLDEGCSYDTLARPDIVAAAWTGAPQSFLDDQASRNYAGLDDLVPRADLLQHRHTLTLRDPWPLFYGWRPFGSVLKDSIEPDLYPWLERGHRRDYQQWTWWAKDGTIKAPLISTGFRQETNRFDGTVPDKLAIIPAPDSFVPLPPSINVPLAPSKRATLQMIAHSLGNIVGERSVSTAVIRGLGKNHPWLEGWTPI